MRYKATYKFKNTATNQYLTVSDSGISFTASGSSFSLEYIEGVEGPALKSSDDHYLVFNNHSLSAVTADKLDTSTLVTVYTGSSYELITNKTSDDQTYEYYDSEAGSLVTLGSSSTPMLFTSTSSTAATVKIGNTKIATLTKEVSSDEETQNATEAATTSTDASAVAEEDVEYYTAHIVIRVWVEGTDREAKTPLADGIFDMSLHFISQ